MKLSSRLSGVNAQIKLAFFRLPRRQVLLFNKELTIRQYDSIDALFALKNGALGESCKSAHKTQASMLAK